MPVFPVAPGEIVLSDTINFIGNFHGARVTVPTLPSPPGSVTVVNNTITAALIWGTVTDNTDGYYSTSNMTRLTIPTGLGGRYLVIARIGYTPVDNAGARVTYLVKNGTIIDGTPFVPVPTYYTYVTYFSVQTLVPTDYLEIKVIQNSGISLDLQSSSYFQIAYLGV